MQVSIDCLVLSHDPFISGFIFRIFEWRSHYNPEETESYSRLLCYDSGSTCYKTEESKCTGENIEKLPFGHCEEDMSMMISLETFKISCGNQVVEAPRCSGENEEVPYKITVKEFSNGMCASRIRPITSGKFFKSLMYSSQT